MTLRGSAYIISICIAIAFGLSACFTGVESTPKITNEKVRDRGAFQSSEQRFASEIAGEIPKDWSVGKLWIVSDPKISLALSQTSYLSDDLKGDTIFLQSTRPVPNIMGKEVIELVLSTNKGHKLYHNTGVTTDDWQDKKSYEIPFTIELSAVEKADSLMTGKTYYISSPRWKDKDGNDVSGLRHVPVKITNVTAGNHLYPLNVVFTRDDSKDKQIHSILMTYGDTPSANRNFDRLFSFTNPRNAFPKISDATWQKIIHSEIAEGMTRDECRLALGTPYTIDYGSTPGMQLERWSYENGVFLLFEDGILTKFRM